MKRSRPTLVGMMLLGALAAGVSAAPAADAVPPPGGVIAVTGTNQALYAKPLDSPTWSNLGGKLIAAPAVTVVNPETTQYVGIGANSMLYQRTDATGWRRLTTIDYKCTEVSTILSRFDGSTVYGACTAGNGALYFFEFDGTQTAPTAPTLTKATQNNEVLSKATLAWGDRFDDPQLLAFYKGSQPQAGAGNTWNVDMSGGLGWGDIYSTNGPGSSGFSFDAFQQDDPMILVTVVMVGWNSYSVPGRSIGSPALIENGDGTAELFVTGTNGVVYTQHLTDTAGSSWTQIPSRTPYGPAVSTPLLS
jgi:hypothetical protein